MIPQAGTCVSVTGQCKGMQKMVLGVLGYQMPYKPVSKTHEGFPSKQRCTLGEASSAVLERTDERKRCYSTWQGAPRSRCAISIGS